MGIKILYTDVDVPPCGVMTLVSFIPETLTAEVLL